MYRRSRERALRRARTRTTLLFDVARLFESLGRYEEAVKAYVVYADQCAGCDDAPKQRYHAALVYGKLGDTEKELGALNLFIERYRKDGSQAELVIDAHRRVAEVQRGLGGRRTRSESTAPRLTASTCSGSTPRGYRLAADAAAQARFQLAWRGRGPHSRRSRSMVVAVLLPTVSGEQKAH